METTKRNFDGLATKAVDKFFLAKDGKDLNSIVSDIASDNTLNPMEVKRLVEKTNLLTMLRFLQTSEDKRVEFTLADYEKVMPMIYSSDEEHTPSAAAATTPFVEKSGIPNLRKEASLTNTTDGLDVLQSFLKQQGISTSLNKTASTKTISTNFRINELFKMEKMAEELRQLKVASELKLNNIVDSLATDFCIMDGPDFKKFAREAIALHGKKATGLLNNIGNVIREDISRIVKTAEMTDLAYKVTDKTIDDTSKEHIKFAEAQEELYTYIKIATQLGSMEEHIAAKWDFVHEHVDARVAQ